MPRHNNTDIDLDTDRQGSTETMEKARELKVYEAQYNRRTGFDIKLISRHVCCG